ncbi:hypothetical protein [Chenggangzhangella methanolivorans]|uniref:hypothetical protein n=1 Tax=Chenggangzhangella methanolivorans TaxID=1437009 RepID=UPI0021BD53BF|nr:hypothetical protein [Chenggangzhangella methanolivorans]
MSNDDVNAVVLRLAVTLQRGEDSGAVFTALIGAAATVAADLGLGDETPDELKRAIESVMGAWGSPRRPPRGSGGRRDRHPLSTRPRRLRGPDLADRRGRAGARQGAGRARRAAGDARGLGGACPADVGG